MKPSGYSGKNLIDKLGYRANETVLVVHAPGEFLKELAKYNIRNTGYLPADHIHAFFVQKRELGKFLESTNFEQIKRDLWVSWPKQASGVKTDLTEQTFRDLILPLGWVDVKVAAVDDTWSGLKFTRRKPVS